MQTKEEMGLSLDHMLNQGAGSHKPRCCSLYLECPLQAHVLKAYSSASTAVGRWWNLLRGEAKWEGIRSLEVSPCKGYWDSGSSSSASQSPWRGCWDLGSSSSLSLLPDCHGVSDFALSYAPHHNVLSCYRPSNLWTETFETMSQIIPFPPLGWFISGILS